MFQLHKNIQTDFLGQIFLELLQFKTFWGIPYIYIYIYQEGVGV